MKLQKISLISLLSLLLVGQGFALKIDYSGITDADAIQMMDKYVKDYKDAIDPAFGAMANSFVVGNVSQPLIGKPHVGFLAIGVNAGVAFSDMDFNNKTAGGKTLNEALIDVPGAGKVNALTIGVAAAPYATLSLDPLAGIFGLNFFADSDITAKLLTFKLGKRGDEFFTDLFSFGLIFRKQIIDEITLVPFIFSVSGVSFSAGLFYTSNEVSTIVGLDLTETMEYDGMGSVAFGADDLNVGMKVKSMTFDADVKGFFNIAYFLDLYAGFGLSFNFSNKIDVNGDITGSIDVYDSSNTLLGSSAQGLKISGEGKGSGFIPRFMIGTQINIWMVKVGAQYTMAFPKGSADTVKSISVGVGVAF